MPGTIVETHYGKFEGIDNAFEAFGGDPAHDTGRRATLTFDRGCVLVDDPMGAERALWSEVEPPARSG